MNKIRIGLAVAIVCAVAFASTAVVAQDNSAQEAKDRAEIEALMWRYTRAPDTDDGTTYAATYTVDGQFVAGTNATKGREVRRWRPQGNGRNELSLLGGITASKCALIPRDAEVSSHRGYSVDMETGLETLSTFRSGRGGGDA
jgi:hypothetical protein